MRKDVGKYDVVRDEYVRATPGHVLETSYFYFEIEPDHGKDLAIIYGGYEKCAPDFQIKRNTYPWYVLEYPLKGVCEFIINSKKHLLKNGILAGFTPDDSHHYKADSSNPFEHIFIAFTGTKARELFEKSMISTNVIVNIYDADRSFYLIQQILENGREKTEYSQDLCTCYLKTLLLEQATSIAQSGEHISKAVATYRKCRKFIDENFSSIKSPSQVADACNINVRYMSRLFKQYQNITPWEHIMRLKLNKAATLLLTSDLSVKTIAYSIGFEDQYHFSRNFKKFYGDSPQKYRKIHI
jgi:AraC-like DNA-binding protein